MLKYVCNMLFMNSKSSTASLLNPILKKKLDSFVLQSMDVYLIDSIRKFNVALSSAHHAKTYIEERDFMIESKDYFHALCVAYHSSLIKKINTIEKAKNDILCQRELIPLKDLINEEANKHIAYLCLVMVEVIEACKQVKLMSPQLTYSTLINNLKEINSNNIYDKFKLAINKFTEFNLFDQEIAEICKHWKAQMELLLPGIDQTEQSNANLITQAKFA